MDLSAIALQGMQQAEAQLETAAINIASVGAASPDGAALDTLDLSTEVVALMSAKNQASANLVTMKTAGEVQQSLIDVLA